MHRPLLFLLVLSAGLVGVGCGGSPPTNPETGPQPVENAQQKSAGNNGGKPDPGRQGAGSAGDPTKNKVKGGIKP